MDRRETDRQADRESDECDIKSYFLPCKRRLHLIINKIGNKGKTMGVHKNKLE
jgi:hypothetical protein